MTRKKVKLAYIVNDSARKATFKKRKKGLMKKVSELTTLCGINACAIIYSPYDSLPEVWPSHLGVQRVLADFRKMPEMEQSKKMVNQESFLRQRIGKAADQLKKQRKDNREKEITHVMFQSVTGRSLSSLNLMDLNDLGWLIDQHLKDIHKRTETLHKAQPPRNPPPTPAATQQPAPKNGGAGQVGRPGAGTNLDPMQRQQWFMDLINPPEHLGFTGDEMMLPFGDPNQIALWSNSFFP